MGRNTRNGIVNSYCKHIFQWLLLIVKILCKLIKMCGWFLSVNIIYKHLNTVFLKCNLISYDKSGRAVRECSYLSICNAMDGATEFTNEREG